MKKTAIIFSLLLSPLSIQAVTEFNSETFNKIDEIFKDYQNKPGVALGIYSKGKIQYSKGYGLANLDYDVPITSKTVFDLESNSMQFTAACIILLENQGKLSQGDDIRKYLPEMPIYPEGTITINHLLNHTSGLRSYLALVHAKGVSWDSNYDKNYAFNLLKNQSALNFVPGTKHRFTTSGYALLSVIIERVSGQTLGEFAKENIFTPLGMDSTFYYENKDVVIKNRAIAYTADGEGFKREHFFNSLSAGALGVYTTIDDFLKWNEMFKNNTIGDKTFLTKLLKKAQLKDGSELEFTNGMYLAQFQGLNTISHNAHFSGFQAWYYNFIELDVSILLLSNNDNADLWGHFNDLTQLLLKDEFKNSSQQTQNGIDNAIEIELSPKQLKKFTGDYFNPVAGFTRQIILKDGDLYYTRPTSRENKLVALTDNKFIFDQMSEVEVEFLVNNNKMQLLFSINGLENSRLDRYTPASYTTKQLQKFVGQYYSKELDAYYNFNIIENRICAKGFEVDFGCLDVVMENTLKTEHDTYFTFKDNANGKAQSFIRNDEHVSNIEFTKVITN